MKIQMQIKALESGMKDLVSKGKKKVKKGFELGILDQIKKKKKEIEDKM
jgi:hypothetical protein